MIQRKQTLFLLLSTLMSLLLLFVNSGTVTNESGNYNLYMAPLAVPGAESTTWHMAAVMLNFISLVLGFVAIFLYRKLSLQTRLCYVLMIFWLALTFIITFAPLVSGNVTSWSINYFGTLFAAIGVLASYLAMRLIRKDIALLKSADRIR